MPELFTKELYEKAVALLEKNDIISVAFLQIKLEIGYPCASEILKMMAENGLVIPADKPYKWMKHTTPASTMMIEN